MFHPFRCLHELKTDNSYWTKFFHELQKHIKNEDTKFWKKGFDILQNINDRDPINMQTHVEEISPSKKHMKTVNEKNDNDILQIDTEYR